MTAPWEVFAIRYGTVARLAQGKIRARVEPAS